MENQPSNKSPDSADTQTDDQNGQSDFAIKMPSISMPKGGGSIRPIGEKFTANPATGSGSMSIPIYASPGRNDFGPQLALSYDSGNGNGPFGFGWSLAIPQISRKTSKGLPQYLDGQQATRVGDHETQDVFILSGSEDLVPLLNDDGTVYQRIDAQTGHRITRFRPRIEGLFARIERWLNPDNGDVHWRSISRDNVTHIYGKTNQSRIFDPDDLVGDVPKRIFSWLLCESYDNKGNAILYEYAAENDLGVNRMLVSERNRSRSAQRYIKRIKYGNQISTLVQPDLSQAHWMFELVFDYQEGHLHQLEPLASIPLDEQHPAVAASYSPQNPWSVRPDPFSTYRSGFEIRQYRRCHRVLMFHHFEELGPQPYLVKATEFDYGDLSALADSNNAIEQELAHQGSTPIASFVQRVVHTSFQLDEDQPSVAINGATLNRYWKASLPPLEFEYTKARIQSEYQFLDTKSSSNLPVGIDDAAYIWTDLNGEGLSGVLAKQGQAWHYKPNLGNGTFGPMQTLNTQPSLFAQAAGGERLLDLNGNGQLDVVDFAGPVPGYYQRTYDHRTNDDGWQSFRTFESLPNIPWNDPATQFLDLTGDGHADVLIAQDQVFTWYPSLQENGFGAARQEAKSWDEEKGPNVVFADAEQAIHLADMSGDSLTDLVRIRNGQVCYWPNLGYGRFGAKVTMDASPHFDHPDQFDPSRLRLVDIDGSGTIDIIYLTHQSIQLYFNYCGNRWSTVHTIPQFPAIDSLSKIKVVDFLGNGTACLVWSSPFTQNHHQPLAYLDLMGNQKPHLLTKTINNLGSETHIHYAPSTKFYLQDKLAGKPWLTRLPFPVHVVEKTVAIDHWRQTRFASTYSYHHGYFDGNEQEFRGFGRVEQVDIESYGEFANTNHSSPFITSDQQLYQPPVKTITWFHTGMVDQRQSVLNAFQAEYFRALSSNFTEHTLPDVHLDQASLNTQEYREALRACKGMVLRQEVYELEVTAHTQGRQVPVRLFSTAFHNGTVRQLQPQGPNRHAVFLATESEAITYQYDHDLRDPQAQYDPRVSHTLNLKIDDYGNVLESVAVGYPRFGSVGSDGLSSATLDKINQVQQELHLVYSETRFTQDVVQPADAYRLRLPCEVETYDLTGVRPQSGGIFTLAELQTLNIPNAVPELAYHQAPSHQQPQKRPVEWLRTLYFAEDLQSPLPMGALNAQALPYENYKLALTRPLLDHVLSDKLTTAVLRDLGNHQISGYLSGTTLAERFTDIDTAGQYWQRSGVAGFADQAANHFYMPEQYTDAFGNSSQVKLDPRDLYIESTTDPLGNRVLIPSTAFDYRVLAPTEVQDINQNRSQTRYNLLGMPVVAAVQGKVTESLGDHLDGLTFTALNPVPKVRRDFFTQPYSPANAQNLLGHATARHLYDFGEQIEANGIVTYGHRPTGSASIVREQHVSSLSDGQVSPVQNAFAYTDGAGQVFVTKNQAEPETEGGPLRWIANGRTIHNNKGKVVLQYEPYFSVDESGQPNHRFSEPQAIGVTPILYYDAAGRLIRTELPDGTLNRVSFSPWQVTSFDANDCMTPDSPWYQQKINGNVAERKAAQQSLLHSNTPGRVYLDSLGRDVISVEHNRTPQADGTLVDEHYTTFTKLDTEGKPLWIRDTRHNLVMQYIFPIKPTRADQEANPTEVETMPAASSPCYDLAGNLLFQHSMDGGDKWTLPDATGQPFYSWDRNERFQQDPENPSTTLMVMEDRVYQTHYDPLLRPLSLTLSINGATPLTIERLVYGESLLDAAAQLNLRGQLLAHYDPSGLVNNIRSDFKGNIIEVQRRLLRDHREPIVHWPENPDDDVFMDETYTSVTHYDALNRMQQLFNWHASNDRVAVYQPQYNERGVLKSETLFIHAERTIDSLGTSQRRGGQPTQAVQNIQYNAKGQRTFLQYGNQAFTRYQYDPQTFRLIQLTSERPTGPGPLQDCLYTYDAVGNITDIIDHAQQTAYFRNQVVSPNCEYQYDALSRLINARGREHAAQNNTQRDNTKFTPGFAIPLQNSAEALARYEEQYHYDSVGNILNISHRQQGQTNGFALSWQRHYQYALDSNRLLATSRPGDSVPSQHYTQSPALSQAYQYDTHGSMLNLVQQSANQAVLWDYRDMIQQVNLGGGGNAFYQYSSEKQRSKKVIEQLGGTREERLYLNGLEVYRRFNARGELLEQMETLHLFVDDQRVLIVEDVLQTDNLDLGVNTFFRYQLGNHLGSVSAELNDNAQLISYEEYHPYGTTAYSAGRNETEINLKRYRYTGMERDEETGLSYHTARYYLPWLGRWGSVDPINIYGGLNLYCYSSSNSINYRDLLGLQNEDDARRLFGPWSYGTPVTDRQELGNNVQRQHVIRVSVRDLQRNWTRGTARRRSADFGETTILVETGRGYFHTEVGRLERNITEAIKNNEISSESEIVEAVREAHYITAAQLGVEIDPQALDASLRDSVHLVHEPLEHTIRELEQQPDTGQELSAQQVDDSLDATFDDDGPTEIFPIVREDNDQDNDDYEMPEIEQVQDPNQIRVRIELAPKVRIELEEEHEIEEEVLEDDEELTEYFILGALGVGGALVLNGLGVSATEAVSGLSTGALSVGSTILAPLIVETPEMRVYEEVH